MDFEDVDLRTVLLKGVWRGWQPLLVRTDSSIPSADDDMVPAPEQAAQPVADASESFLLQSQSFDLLEEVAGAPQQTSRRGRGKGRGKGKSRSSQVRNSLIAALPFDPAMDRDLQAELEALLADENVLLGGAATATRFSDAASAREILDAVRICQDANPPDGAHFAESGDDEIVGDSVDLDLEPEADDAGIPADGDEDEEQPSTSSASRSSASGVRRSAMENNEEGVDEPDLAAISASTSSSSGDGRLVERALGLSEAGNPVVLLESKHGNNRFEVWERCRGGKTLVLGKICLISFSDKAVYKATCSWPISQKHSSFRVAELLWNQVGKFDLFCNSCEIREQRFSAQAVPVHHQWPR